MYSEFVNTICKHDIFFLFETFVTEDHICKYEKYFGDFNLFWVPAKRNFVVGRASGGCLFGVSRRNMLLKYVRFVENYNRVYLEMLVGNKLLYIIPIYLNFNNWGNEFESLCSYLSSLCKVDIMLIGDFNARVGSEQTLTSNTGSPLPHFSRQSKDGTINRNGRMLLELLQNYDLSILNGACLGDCNGEMTFINKNGSSVIDLCCASGDWVYLINDFEVCPLQFSEHMPVRVRVSLTISTSPQFKLLPKLRWYESKVGEYKNYIGKVCDECHLTGNEFLAWLMEVIRKASNPCQVKRARNIQRNTEKWYDSDCAQARNKSFDSLNKYRTTLIEADRLQYLVNNKAFKHLCVTKKQSYFQAIGEKLSRVSDSAKFWKIVKEINGSTNIKKLSSITPSEFAAYFNELLNPYSPRQRDCFVEPFIKNDILDRPVSIMELNSVLRKAKNQKAPGEDRIPYEFYKNLPQPVLIKVVDAFNTIFDSGNIPEGFNKSIIVPLLKKGNPESVTNYRGISCCNTIAQILSGIFLKRIEEWVDENSALSEAQFGFRKGFSTVDSIFVLKTAVEYSLLKKRKVYAFFIDFKAAFDWVDRQSLFIKLHNKGLSTKIIKIVKKLYEHTKSAVWNGQELSQWFSTKNGVKQGCILSPILFTLFIDDIVECVTKGITVDGIKIKLLMYADDVVFLCESAEDLQKSINNLYAYCKRWNMTINLDKSKIMVFRNGGKISQKEKWYWESNIIEIVNEYKYLGVILTSSLSMTKHLKQRLKLGKSAVNTTWKNYLLRKDVPHSAKAKVYEAAVRSIVCYAAQVWGYRQFDDVEKIQRFFVKRIFWLPNTTPNYMICLETGLAPIFIYTLKQHFDYIYKVVKTYSAERLAARIAKVVFRSRILWVEEWVSLAQACEYDFSPIIDMDRLELENLYGLLAKVDELLWKNMILEARSSQHRYLYKTLSFDLGSSNGYFNDSNSIQKISLIFKARGELLPLNYMPHVQVNSDICGMCNLGVRENVEHFLAICPMLYEIRRLCFNSNTLYPHQVNSLLNGSDWGSLALFINKALIYRSKILNENF